MSGVLNIFLAQYNTSGNPRYVTTYAGATADIGISDDGLTWQTSTAPKSNEWNTPAYMSHCNTFVISGGFSGATDNIIYSQDGGVNWSAATTPVNVSANDGFTFVHRTTTYDPITQMCVVSGNRGPIGNTSSMLYSNDGISWTSCTFRDQDTGTLDTGNHHINDIVARAGGGFIGVGTSFTSLSRRKWLSSDGITWYSRSETDSLTQITCAGESQGIPLFFRDDTTGETNDEQATDWTYTAATGSVSQTVLWCSESPNTPGKLITTFSSSITKSTNENITRTEVSGSPFAQRISSILWNGTRWLGWGAGPSTFGRVVSSEDDGDTWVEETLVSTIIGGFYHTAMATNHPFTAL